MVFFIIFISAYFIIGFPMVLVIDRIISSYDESQPFDEDKYWSIRGFISCLVLWFFVFLFVLIGETWEFFSRGRKRCKYE